MPFQDSIISGTKPHVHSALSTQGGFLETGATGMTNLSEGSLIYGNASEIQTELISGLNAEVLTLAGGVPTWASASGVSMTRTLIAYSTAQSTSSTALVSLTGLQASLGSGSGHAILLFNGICETDESFAFNWAFSVDANPVEVAGKASPVGVKPCNYTAITETLSSQTVDLQFRVKNPAGTATMQVDNTNSNFYILEIA